MKLKKIACLYLTLLLALPCLNALAMQAGLVSPDKWRDVTSEYGKAAKDTAVKVAVNPVTGNQALCLSVAFDKENWWCDAAALKTVGSTAFHKMESISYDVYFVPREGTGTTGSMKMQTCLNTPSWYQVPDSEIAEIAMKAGGAFAHVTQKLPGAAIHSQLILAAAGAATDFSGDIYFENITLTAIPEKAEEVPLVEPKFWDFEDEQTGLGDWGVEGSWEYPGGFTLDQISYEPQQKALKITGLHFSKNKEWSEIKLNAPMGGLNLKGYGLFSIELTVDSEAYRLGGGDFRVQPTAIMAGGSYRALGNGYPAKTTDNAGGTTTLLYEIGFVSDLTMDSMTVGIAGSSTAYEGDIHVDNVLLSGRRQGEYMGVNATVKPKNGRPPQNTAIDTSMPIPLVDENATPETKSLFVYLRDVGKEYTLFGHQNAMHHGISITKTDGSESDVKNAVGAHPGIVGLDGLSLFGGEGTYDQSVVIAKAAYKARAILTMSMHMPNFVTGGIFSDVTAGAIRAVLPGGEAHQKLLDYLDTVAAFAKDCVTEDGTLIPILLRPYHEGNGGWFWWGSASGNDAEAQQLYRFTVEYLRDNKGVHNFLYAYAPNGPVSSVNTYLQRYPGDNYVDVLGFDYYCDDAGESTVYFMNQLKQSCIIVSDLAAARGKVSAVCETGVRQLAKGYEGLAPQGNQGSLTWYTDILDTLSTDPKVSRISYFMVWANFNDGQFWVPYVRPGDKTSHEMADNFITFYNDDRVIFADRTGDIYSHCIVEVLEKEPFVSIVYPATNKLLAKENFTFQADVKPYGKAVEEIRYTVLKTGVDVSLTLSQSGYYEGLVDISNLRNSFYDTVFLCRFSDGTVFESKGSLTVKK